MVGTGNSTDKGQDVCGWRGEVRWKNKPNRSWSLRACACLQPGSSEWLPSKSSGWVLRHLYQRMARVGIFYSLGQDISAEHRQGFWFQPVCASPQGNGKYPAPGRRKETYPCSDSTLAVWLWTSHVPSLNWAPGICAQHSVNICWIVGNKYACFPAMSFLLSGAISNHPPWKGLLKYKNII